MIDLPAIRAAFPGLTDIQPIGGLTGQKDVFSARREDLKVCLKLVKSYQGGEDRSIREVEAVARLASDYVPRIYEHGLRQISGEERLFIVEQFIEGQTYRAILGREPVPSLSDLLDLAKMLLEACADFEQANLVHRDIKPGNLIRGQDGKLWVIDFGLARHLDRTSLTLTGLRFGVGTIGYAAPEQFRNIKSEINSRADLFSIGVVLYESLAGKQPYRFDPPDPMRTIRKVEGEDLPFLTIPGDCDGEFSRLISALVQRFPSRRPQSAAQALLWFEPVYAKLKGS